MSRLTIESSNRLKKVWEREKNKKINNLRLKINRIYHCTLQKQLVTSSITLTPLIEALNLH